MLVKEGNLRVVLTVLKKRTKLQEHRTRGPLTLQVLSGSVRFSAAGRALEMGQEASLFSNQVSNMMSRRLKRVHSFSPPGATVLGAPRRLSQDAGGG